MAKDPWDEYSDLTIRLGWLERELGSAATRPADKADLVDEIRKIAARRDAVVPALGECAGKVVQDAPAAQPEPLLIGFQ